MSIFSLQRFDFLVEQAQDFSGGPMPPHPLLQLTGPLLLPEVDLLLSSRSLKFDLAEGRLSSRLNSNLCLWALKSLLQTNEYAAYSEATSKWGPRLHDLLDHLMGRNFLMHLQTSYHWLGIADEDLKCRYPAQRISGVLCAAIWTDNGSVAF